MDKVNNENDFIIVDNSLKKNKLIKNKQNKENFEEFCSSIWPQQRNDFIDKCRSSFIFHQKKHPKESEEEYLIRVDYAVESARRKSLDCGRSNSDCYSYCKYNTKCDANRRNAFDQYKQYNIIKKESELLFNNIDLDNEHLSLPLPENEDILNESDKINIEDIVNIDTFIENSSSQKNNTELENVQLKEEIESILPKQTQIFKKKKVKTQKQINEEKELKNLEAFINNSSIKPLKNTKK